MNKAGTSVHIDFTVTDAHLAAGRRMMVALDFLQTKDGRLEEALLQEAIAVDVDIALIRDGRSTAVPVQDNRAILEPSRQRANDGVANLHLYGHDVASVKTVRDQPEFAGVPTMVRIAPFYNTGE